MAEGHFQNGAFMEGAPRSELYQSRGQTLRFPVEKQQL